MVTRCMAVAVPHIALFTPGEVCTHPGMPAVLLKCMIMITLFVSDTGSLTELA